MTTAEKIREARGSMTAEEFSEVLGCKVQSIIWWESGRYTPPNATLSLLGITPENIQGFEEIERVKTPDHED